MRSSVRAFSVFFVGALILAQPADALAQKKEPFTRYTPQFLKAFREVVAPAAKSTVRVLCDGKETSLGFIVEADGWILTKAHDLKGTITVKHDGKTYDARLAGVHKVHDLALLKIQAMGLTPVVLADSKTVPVGAWVASPGISEDPVAVGVVSVATRDLPNKGGPVGSPSPNAGYLGVQLDSDPAGIKVMQVVPKTPAEKAGIKNNDIILALQGKKVAQPEQFMELMSKTRAGDTVTLKIKRGEDELEIKPKLEKRPFNRGDMQNSMGSELSSRRGGYPTILQHDSVVKPADCGGPIVDLQGRVIGMNASRAGRVETWAVPSEVIRPLLAELKSGKFAVKTSKEETKQDPAKVLAALEAAVDEARGQAIKAQTNFAKALTDLEKAKLDNDLALEKLIRRTLAKAEAEVKDSKKRLEDARGTLEKTRLKFKNDTPQKKDENQGAAPRNRVPRAALAHPQSAWVTATRSHKYAIG